MKFVMEIAEVAKSYGKVNLTCNFLPRSQCAEQILKSDLSHPQAVTARNNSSRDNHQLVVEVVIVPVGLLEF